MNHLISKTRLQSQTGSLIKNIPQKHVLDRKGLAFLWRYTRPHLNKLIWASIISLPIAALSGIIAWSVKQATQSFTNGAMQLDMFLWLGAAIMFMIFCSCLQLLNTYILSSLQATIGNNIRIDLYDEIQKNALSFHSNTRTGELSNLIGNDSQYASGGVVELYATFWQRPVIIICLVGFMVYMNPMLTLLSLTFFPLLSICVIKISQNARHLESLYIQNQGELMGDMIESLTNIRQVKAFGREAGHRQILAQKCDQLLGFFKKVVLIKSLVSPATEILSSIGVAAMAVMAYFQLQQGTTTPGAIIGCLTAAISLKRVTKEFSSSIVELQRSFAAIHRISRLSGFSEQYQNLYTIEAPVKTITFENVFFSHDREKHIIKAADFELKRGDRIAIIGQSGSGKTSLLDMITGFYPCSSGAIKINGYNLTDVSLESWRNQIGIVTQEPFLFDDSIFQNIKYGNPDADDETVLTAAGRAGCSEMINRLPDGIDTIVGERGCRLSGGERKRIALARAIVRPISVLLLDEATSELDMAIEEKILKVIDDLATGMIVINVSHRPSAVHHSDRILLINNGRVREISAEDANVFLERHIFTDKHCGYERTQS